MRLFARSRADGPASSSSRAATGRDVNADQESPVRAQQQLRQPLLDRHASQLSYGSLVDQRPSSERRARSRRRKTRTRTSVYADPPPSYRRALLSYTLVVTIPSILTLFIFGLLKFLIWPRTLHPSPLREFCLAAGSYVVSYALRVPILYISTLGNTYFNGWTMTLSTFLHVTAQEAIRLAMLVLLQIHLERPSEQALLRDGDTIPPGEDWAPLPDVWDAAFTQVWWLALGWATIDVAVGIVQGYEQLSLYRDAWSHARHHHLHHDRETSHGRVAGSTSSPSPPPHTKSQLAAGANERRESTLTVDDSPHHTVKRPASRSHIVYTLTPQHVSSADLTATYDGVGEGEALQESTVIIAEPMDLEAELSHLLKRKQRAELEGVYGSPLPRIPVFLIALQRLDSILLSLGLTLLVSAAYLRAFYLPAVPTTTTTTTTNAQGMYQQDWQVDWSKVKDTTAPILCGVVLVHFLLSMLWIEALPRIGVHTASYVGLLVSLAVLFAGLGCWGALI